MNYDREVREVYGEHTGEDYRLPPGTVVYKFRTRCGCGIRYRNVRVTENATAFFRATSPPPGLVVLSYWCESCKETVGITARQLGWAA